MEGRMFLLVAIGLCAAAMARPGDRPKPMEGPPPVDADFTGNCTAQREADEDIECEGVEFAPVQCKGRHCFCVDTDSGERLSAMRFMRMDKDNINCTEALQCPEVLCNNVCPNGYELDRDCQTCRCKRGPPRQMCMTITALVLDGGCSCECVGVPQGTNCPMCNAEPCDSIEGPIMDEQCVNDTECENGTIQSVGPRGKPVCVQDLPEGDDCDPKEPGPAAPAKRPMPVGAAARMRLAEIGEVVTPCQEGTVCVQVGLRENRCKMEDEEAPCVQEKLEDASIKCERDGSFKPLQCREANSTDEGEEGERSPARTEVCRCVDKNGTTIEGTETVVQGARDRPQCKERKFESCEVAGVGGGRRGNMRRFKVEHGEQYYDAANCRTCQCSDGNSTAFCSDSANCTVTVVNDIAEIENCTLPNGEELAHEESRSLGCDSCGCRNGRLRCTHQHRCNPEGEEKDECDMCRRRPPGPVCGPDGRNHRSVCEGVQCAGFPAPALANGPCQDVCQEYPCKEDEICIAKKGVACMGRHGCNRNQLRTCMKTEDLRCPAESEEDTEVCGSDDQTYSSICNLLQSTSGVTVAHDGPCDNDECDNTTMVCGSDGVTYPHVCLLRSLSSSARVDYLGECERGTTTIEEICEMVRSSGRCTHNESNCDRLVSTDGCCPLCGGVTVLAIDQEALDDASQTSSALRTVDGFTGQMAAAEVFSDLPGKCDLEATLTNTGDIQMLFAATRNTHAKFCQDKSEELAMSVRGASGTNPQVFDYVLAAAAAPIETTTTDPGDNGAPPAAVVPCLLLVASLLMGLAAAL